MGSFKKILGTADDHYSQRNNEYKKVIKGELGTTKMSSGCMCNVTVMCEAAHISGWHIPGGNYKQDEDNFCECVMEDARKANSWFATTKSAYYKDWYINGGVYNKDKKIVEPVWPNEIHDVLAHYFNAWVGCDTADKFFMALSNKSIFQQIIVNNRPVPTSVKFGKLNHIILITGAEWSAKEEASVINEISKTNITYWTHPDFVYYTDPYGIFSFDTNVYIQPNGGWANKMTWDQYLACVKDTNNNNAKFAHILGKPAALV